MPYMHQRGPEKIEDLVMPYMLDCVPFALYQAVGLQHWITRPAATERTVSNSPPVALPWLQSSARRKTFFLYLLVWKRSRASIYNRPSAPFLWTDMWQGTRPSEEMPSSLRAHVPRRPMSSLYTYWPKTELLLRQGNFPKEVHRNTIRGRVVVRQCLR